MKHENNFNILRLIAAFQVLLGHSINQLDIAALGSFEHVIELFPGVPVFFIVSGFLIGGAFQRSESTSEFAFNRIKRIFPGLWVAYLLAVMVILYFGVEFEGAEFMVWSASQITVFQSYDPEFLTTFGAGKMNPPLWTILVELQFYIMTPFLCMLVTRKKPWVFIFIFIFLLLMKLGNNYLHIEGGILGKALNQTLFPHLYLFLMGICISYSDKFVNVFLREKVLFWIAIYAVVISVAGAFGLEVRSNWQNPIVSAVLGMLALSFALSNVGIFKRVNPSFDISYGIYIYHYIFINIFIVMGWMFIWEYLLGLVMAVIAASLLSWYLVEKPALSMRFIDFKGKLTRVIG